VPANQIVDLEPGQMFVHRNIANVVPHSDPNSLAVIQYAVEYLGVKHIVVVGHYGCGGVRAAMSQVDHGQIDNWLAHIKDVHSRYFEEISALDDPDQQLDRLCELNVTVQVRNVAKTSIVQHAWRTGRKLSVHGWIYDLKDGILHDLGTTLSAIKDLHAPYRILK
jgi:carbonic anhydrase